MALSFLSNPSWSFYILCLSLFPSLHSELSLLSFPEHLWHQHFLSYLHHNSHFAFTHTALSLLRVTYIAAVTLTSSHIFDIQIHFQAPEILISSTIRQDPLYFFACLLLIPCHLSLIACSTEVHQNGFNQKVHRHGCGFRLYIFRCRMGTDFQREYLPC